jgi:hypothetical protein
MNVASTKPVWQIAGDRGPPHMMPNRSFLIRLLCVALVAAVMIPLGNAVFPYVSGALDGTQFQALEAVLSATLGFGIHALIG